MTTLLRTHTVTRRHVLGGGAAIAAAAAACGPLGGQSTQPAAKTSTPVTIGWDTFRGYTPPTEWPKVMVETFEAKHPHIKLDARPISLDGGSQQSAYPKMYAMVASGTLGDVFAWDPSHWQFYGAIKRNVIRELDDFIKRDKYDLNQFYKPFIEYQKWQGKIWGLPSWGWTGQDGLLYNTELIQQAGVTLPDYKSTQWTMNALYDMVVKVYKLVERSGGFGMTTTLPGAAGLTIFCRAFNGDNLSPDGKKSLLMDAKPKEALRWVYDLAHKEKAIAIPGRYEGDLFLNGKLGFEHAGSLSVANRNIQNKDGLLKFKAALFPKRQDGKRPSQLRGGTWNTGKQGISKYAEQGWLFIQHITSRDAIIKFNTIGGNTSLVRPDIMNDPFFQDPNFRVYLENFENTMVHVVPANLNGTEYEGAVSRGGRPWYLGEMGFEDGLRSWNDEIQRVLDLPES